ncbi:MAG: ferrous iron transport protein A [Betaproteobacteria bacterium]|nr:ferrous iron transport protein A [Betaproteobacteria bacterium]
MLSPTPSPTLDRLQPGESATIIDLRGDTELIHRLTALGVRAGKCVQVLRRAAFAGPLHIRVGTTDLMLRLSEACCVGVTSARC